MRNPTLHKMIKKVTAGILAAALIAANTSAVPEWKQKMVFASETEMVPAETKDETETEPVPETQQETEPSKETEQQKETEAQTETEQQQETVKEETEVETEISPTEVPETEEKQTEESEKESNTLSEDVQTETERETETEETTEKIDYMNLCSCMEDSDDPFDHDPDCPYFVHGLLQYCDCGCVSENLEEHDENCMCRQLLRQMEEEADLIDTFAKELAPSGVPLSGVAGWKKVTADYKFSSEYYPVKYYDGITQIQTFKSSGQVVEGKLPSGNTYFYPTKAGLGGTFGILYKKVLYQNNKWYDLRMTVVNYTTSISCDNSKTTESYPFLCTKAKRIGWSFNQALGGLVAKCEFLETGTDTKAAVNTRFQWWDIDAAQRFGMKTGDGSVNGRYYYDGTQLYVQTNKSVAGMGGMEVVVGPGEISDSSDPRFCVTYELKNCSTYYISFGERDHIDDDEYSYSKSHVDELNEQLASGTHTGAENAEYLLQTDTSMSLIDTPGVVKSVSDDGINWKTECTLKSCDTPFWYQLNQFVPWQDNTAYYESFVIKDQLPAGVLYKGELKILRSEDKKDVTDQFVVSEKDGMLTVTAKSAFVESSSFYAYHYSIVFKAALEKEKIKPQKQQNKMIYTVINKASLIYKHKAVGGYTEKESNEVKTMAEIIRTEAPDPKKGIDGDEKMVQKIIMMQDEKIVFSVFQDIPVNDSVFYPLQINMEDSLEECLEYESLEVEVQKKNEKEFVKAEKFSITGNGQNIMAKGELDAQYNGGKVRYQISCKIKKNMDLQKWKTGQPDGGIWTRIPNKASVSLSWNGETPVTKVSNEVEVKLRENHIRIKKEIDVPDIVWAHGEPTFTFRVSGKDLSGKEHTYYKTVVFQKNNISGEKKTRLEADFVVPAGVYTVSEEKTMRYQLEQISEIENGTGGGDKVTFDLSQGKDGSACFYNKKFTDGEESHTDFVENKIGG